MGSVTSGFHRYSIGNIVRIRHVDADAVIYGVVHQGYLAMTLEMDPKRIKGISDEDIVEVIDTEAV